MSNIRMSVHRELNFANKKQLEAVAPIIVSSLTDVGTPRKMPDTTKPFSIMATALEYEVFCPNCGRAEIASMHELVKHRCNCGYGVFVEMLRTSPN